VSVPGIPEKGMIPPIPVSSLRYFLPVGPAAAGR
jgi:hypothetical protein